MGKNKRRKKEGKAAAASPVPGAPAGRKTEPSAVKRIVPFLFIALAVLAAYSNSLDGRFIWDDAKLIRDNVNIREAARIPNMFTDAVSRDAGVKQRFYRPVLDITYFLDYSRAGLEPRAYHMTNVVLQILAAGAVYLLIMSILGDRLTAFFAAALFAAHPVHTEAVSYISGRADPLMAIFLLISMISYVKSLDGGRKGAAKAFFAASTVIFFILSLLSKENAVILPFLMAVYHLVYKKDARNPAFAGVALTAIIYGVFRFYTTVPGGGGEAGAFTDRLPGVFAAFGSYCRLLALPFDLHMEYGYRFFKFGQAEVLLGMAGLAAFLCIVYTARKNKTALFGALWFLICLIPVSNIYPINAYMAEHWLYLPSIGIFMIAGSLLSSIYFSGRFRYMAIVCFIGAMSLFSILTFKQNDYWKDPITFYERTLSYTPESYRLWNNLANEYKDLGRYDEAIMWYKKTLEVNPDPGVFANLGKTYIYSGNYEAAIPMYMKAIALDPDNIDAMNDLGVIYSSTGKYSEAVKIFENIISKKPLYVTAYFNCARAFYGMGDMQKASEYYRRSLEMGHAPDPELEKNLQKKN